MLEQRQLELLVFVSVLSVALSFSHVNVAVVPGVDVQAPEEVSIKPVLVDGQTDVTLAVCKALNEGVSGIVDTSAWGDLTTQRTQELAETHGVPYVSVSETGGPRGLRICPTREEVAKAVRELLLAMDWESFTVLYDTLEHLSYLEPFINIRNLHVDFVKIENTNTIRSSLESVSESVEHKFVLALTPENLADVLTQAPSIGLNTTSEVFFIASLDSDTAFEYEFLRNSDSKFLVLRPQNNYQDSIKRSCVRDAVAAISLTARKVQFSEERNLCTSETLWEDGVTLTQELRKIEMEGETGLISFNEAGERSYFNFTLVQKSTEATKPILYLTSEESVRVAEWDIQPYRLNRAKRQLPTLRVFANLNPPYIMPKPRGPDETPLIGNERYEGLCVDILDTIAAYAGFNYVLTVKENRGGAGAFDPNTGRWSGLVGELVRKSADVIIGDITVTRQREGAIDFTKPWHTLGIGILGAKPTYEGPSLFQFLDVFTIEVWVYLLVAFIFFTLIFFLIARLTPYERTPPAVSETLNWSPYTFLNSGWFTISALLRQTPIQQPRALSTRFLGGIWWLFTLLMVALFILNLTYMTQVESLEKPIESIYDLANQNKIKYGAVYEGSTWRHFKTSQVPVYQKIYAGLQNSLSLYRPATTEDALDIIRKTGGHYMYFMEEPTLEFITERQCDVTRYGGQVGPLRAYSFGLQKGSRYLDKFNDALLLMRENGELHLMYRKWISEKMGGGRCEPDEKVVDHEYYVRQITGDDVGGIFIILVIGVTVGLIIAIVECCCYAASQAKQKGDPFGGELANQFKEAVRGPPSSNPNVVINAH